MNASEWLFLASVVVFFIPSLVGLVLSMVSKYELFHSRLEKFTMIAYVVALGLILGAMVLSSPVVTG